MIYRWSRWDIISGWWFGTFLIFHNIWDNPSHWLSYFSRWLKTTNQIWYNFIHNHHNPWLTCHSWYHESYLIACHDWSLLAPNGPARAHHPPLGAAKLQLPVEEPWNGCNFAAAATTTVSRLASSLLYLIVNRTILNSFPRHSFDTNWQPARIEDARSISATVFCLGHVVVLWLFWGEQTSGLMMEDSWKTCRLWDEVLAILGSTFQSVSAYNMLQWYYIYNIIHKYKYNSVYIYIYCIVIHTYVCIHIYIRV